MAFPVILVSSVTGTDGICSGAGPATALAGVNNASTDGAGTTVTVQAGVDWTGVATDGSHVLYFADTTAGNRRYTTITGSAGSGGATPTLTVSPALGLTVTNKTWAVGGKLGTIGSSSSKVLFDNNGASGDAMPGWIIQLEDAHIETITANLIFRRAGDTTSGPIILRGADGAATLPVVTFSNNGAAFTLNGNYQHIRDFELRNSNATKTASIAITQAAGSGLIRGMKISHSTDKYWKAILLSAATGNASVVIDSEIGNCANAGIDNSGSVGYRIISSYIHDCGATAGIVSSSAAPNTIQVYGCVIANNTGDGLRLTPASSSSQDIFIAQNTFYNNTSDGLEMTQVDASGAFLGTIIANNIFANNGAYGVNISVATSIALSAAITLLLNNNFYSNSSGTHFPATLASSENETTSDPQFTSTSGADFSIGTNLKKTGYPLGGTLKVGKGSGTYSYPDPGAAQRNEDAIFGYLPVAP